MMTADWGSVYLAVCLVVGAGAGLFARLVRGND